MGAEYLSSQAKRLPTSKQPGVDGLYYERLRLWPLQLWEMVAELYDIVEHKGMWPEALRCAEVCLNPKGESGQPLDYRPVMLLPVLSRFWAGLRVRDIRKWMKQVNINPLPNDLRSAEEQGLSWALSMEEARVSGEDSGGVAKDMKVYDKVPHGVLEELVRHIDVPQWLARP